MKERALIEKSIEPTQENMKSALNNSYKYYDLVLNKTSNYENKWTFHKGWLQKIYDKKKALIYVVPHEDSFMVSAGIRENEREEMLKRLELSFIFDKLDENRVGQLLELVNTKAFGQIFITDTDRDRSDRILRRLEASHKLFEVLEGKVNLVSN